jgi:hypothetical protein
MATRTRVPAWFWVLAILIVLWGAAGCFACLQQVRLGAEAMGPASAYDRALYARLPAWYNPVYAVATGAGLLGGIALLARRGVARVLFIVSLAAVIVQFGYLFVATDIIAVRGAGTVVPFPVLIAAIAAAEVWFATLARRRGWIG